MVEGPDAGRIGDMARELVDAARKDVGRVRPRGSPTR
jgi:hypothetical protein